MARFKYLGEDKIPRSYVAKYGPTLALNIPLSNNEMMTLSASDLTKGFAVGQDIGVDITDARSIRLLGADPRFSQIS